MEIARKCHVKCKIGVIYGRAGLGKTTAIKEYVSNNSDTIFIEADLGYTVKVLFRKIHKILGMNGVGLINEMHEDIIKKLSGTGRLIIIDEAEHLPYRALELLRRIYDKAGIGILLVGMPRLYHNLCGNRGDYEQLYTRALYKISLEELKPEDVRAIVEKAAPDSGELWKIFYEYCKGNARMLSNLLENAIETARLSNKPITPELIKYTAKLIYCEMFVA